MSIKSIFYYCCGKKIPRLQGEYQARDGYVSIKNMKQKKKKALAPKYCGKCLF